MNCDANTATDTAECWPTVYQAAGCMQCPFGHRRDVIIYRECLTISMF